MKRPAVLLTVVLFALSFGLIGYRILWLNYPLFPPLPEQAWQLSMEAFVKADRGEVNVLIGFPTGRSEQIVAEERITSGELNFNLLREDSNQIGVWSGPVEGGERIGYGATLLKNPERPSRTGPPSVGPIPPVIDEEDQALIKRLTARWTKLLPGERLLAVVETAKGNLGSSPPNPVDLKAWSLLKEKYGSAMALLGLLRASGLPSRIAEGLILSEGVTTALMTRIQAWAGEQWKNISPDSGEIYRSSEAFLPLTTGGLPAVRISRGEIHEIRWTVTKQIISQWQMHFERIKRSSHLLDHWSLFRLPAEFQRTFRILLLVPIGALMICILRNVVGFPTFGIFMPVLMALAFRNTGLGYGLLIFSGVIVIGYAVRRALDRFHLLLVPRLSVLLTLVVFSFTGFALVGNEIGMSEIMAVGLLPFVILTMTIERVFVLSEESGILEALRTAAGSAAVAAITFFILHLDPLQITFFVYPELLFAVAGVQVLVGRYTGYRLSEYFRFRWLRGSS
jgi:hypothetical protein